RDHPDGAARHLRPLQRRLHGRPGALRRAGHRLRRPAALGQAAGTLADPRRWRPMSGLEVRARDRLRELELDVELQVGGNRCAAIVGPSGAGKSTVLRIIAGLRRPEPGRVAVGDEVWLDSSRGIDLPPEERACGFMFQDYALFPHLSAWRNVAFGLAGDRATR